MHYFQNEFLIQNSKSDKIHYHGYHRIYPWFLGHFRNKQVTLLEIGVDKSESLKLWGNYFKNISLHGIDIDKIDFNDPRIILHKIDQSNKNDLNLFAKNVNTDFDIIIDDGSHVPEHQLLTLNTLWKLLKPGGIYIIEDIETSFWGKSSIYGYNFNSKVINTLEICKNLINQIYSEFNKSKKNFKYVNNVAEDLEMITFAYNSIILIKKNSESFAAYYNREYRYEYIKNIRAIYKYPKKIIKYIFRAFSFKK